MINMTEYITEYEYKMSTMLHANFVKCLCDCANEISEIVADRPMRGVFDGDVDLWDGLYIVTSEWDERGNTVRECIVVPTKYLYDEDYRKSYRVDLESERKMQEKALQEQEERDYDAIRREYAEYERLKLKFNAWSNPDE